jgi:hypothetical protein
MAAFFAIWSALVGTTALVMAFARTGPDEARSKLSEWAEFFGFKSAADWLRRHALDRRVLRYGRWLMIALLFSGGMIFQAWLAASSEKNRQQSPPPEQQSHQTPPDSLPPPSRPLSPAEADRKVKTIDQFLDLLGDEMQPLISRGSRLQTGAWNAFADPKNNPNYAADLFAYIELAKSTDEKLRVLIAKHLEYPDLAAAVDSFYPIGAAASNFQMAYGLLATYLSKNADTSVFYRLMAPFSDPFARDIVKFREWRDGAQKN